MISNQAATAVSSNDEWPDLVSLESPTLPSIDLSLIPGWAGQFARELSDATETPPELAAATVLATCSAAAARRLNVRVKEGYFEPCNLWLVVALPSGNRKSSVLTQATLPLIEWETDERARLQPERNQVASERKTKEARAQSLRKKSTSAKSDEASNQLALEAATIEASLPDVPPLPQLWTSDATPERLGTLLAENEECLAWLSAEGGIFDLLQGRYSNGVLNLDLILKAHSGDAERVDRGSREPVFLVHPRLSLGLSPQPDVLRGLASKPGFRGRGLLARFLYFLPPSPLGYRNLESEPISSIARENYANGLGAMLSWERNIGSSDRSSCHTLSLSSSAYDEWLQFAKAVERRIRPGSDMEQMQDWGSKAPGAAARLAGVMHGIEHSFDEPWASPISAETMEHALEVIAVTTEHSLTALQLMGADSHIAAAMDIWKWLRDCQIQTCTQRDVFLRFRSQLPRMEDVSQALGVLVERGYVRNLPKLRSSGPGRPRSPSIEVRPDINGSTP